jgi:heat-inducible transcriptional repressor
MNTSSLSERQTQILKAVIEEYIDSAEPVGSETLEKKYNLGVSPATIRNEMVRLTQLKMLHQPHASAGRSPTPEALRYYVESLMKTKNMSVAEEVSVKEKVWDFRQEMDKCLRETTKTLAQKTKTLAFTTTDEGDMYYAGAANILGMPEFFDYDLTYRLLATLDQAEFWWEMVSEHSDPFDVLLGEAFGARSVLSECGVVYCKFSTPSIQGVIGIVGPSRLNYQYVIPVVRYVGTLVGEMGNRWK